MWGIYRERESNTRDGHRENEIKTMKKEKRERERGKSGRKEWEIESKRNKKK